MIVAVFGVPGNMGTKVVEKLLEEDYITRINLLVNEKKGIKKIIRALKNSKKEFKITYGTVANYVNVQDTIEGTDYVIDMAAVIPPRSDKNPQLAIEANEYGPKVIAKAIEAIEENQPRLIHVSTIGVYGDRSYKHPFAEVGDPLIISPFDIYSLTKMRGEFTVLESDIEKWVVLRQTAMLYDDLMSKNISDGLLFHTCFNSPLEWVTAEDSAILIRNILRRDRQNELNDSNFWKHCFNIGGGVQNRVFGYDTFQLGFEMIGCSTEDFFDTNYNSTRNFHGEWYSDGYKLNDLFDFQHETIKGFWKHVADTHKYFALAKLCPKKMMKAMVIKPLLKDDNAPYYWNAHKDGARMNAYFDGFEAYNSIPKSWEEFGVVSKGRLPDGGKVNYEELKNNPTRINHFFDIDKDMSLITIEDLDNVASARGGKLLTRDFKTGDVYRKLEWENSTGHRFIARPYTVLYCGHWHNVSYRRYAWDFDHQAKVDKMIASIWYDSHRQDENRYYWFDSHFVAHYKIDE